MRPFLCDLCALCGECLFVFCLSISNFGNFGDFGNLPFDASTNSFHNLSNPNLTPRTLSC